PKVLPVEALMPCAPAPPGRIVFQAAMEADSRITRAAAAISLLGLVAGVAAWILGSGELAAAAWSAIAALAIPLVGLSLIAGLRQRRLGVDVIALLALGGALLYRQPLAGALIATMFSTGQALEVFAQARARGELTALLDRAPKTVQVYREGTIVSRPATAIRAGDRLLVKPGEVVAVDGTVAAGDAGLDEAAGTGAPRAVAP